MLARFKWPILLAVIGIGFEVLALVSFLNAFRDSGTLFYGPGDTSFNIKKPGEYVLWHESKTVIDGQFLTFPDDLPSGTTVKVVNETDGTPVVLRRSGSSSHMEKSGTRRVAVGKLTFRSPGKYRVTISDLPEKRAFYLDESKFLKTFLTVTTFGFVGLAFLLAAFGFGLYALIQIITARRNPQPKSGAADA
jgi:hypothetical protein